MKKRKNVFMLIGIGLFLIACSPAERPQQDKTPIIGDWKRTPSFYHGPNNNLWPTPNTPWTATVTQHIVIDSNTIDVCDTNPAQPSDMYNNFHISSWQFYGDSILQYSSQFDGYSFWKMVWVRNDTMMTSQLTGPYYDYTFYTKQ
jgi:hypothetical protein